MTTPSLPPSSRPVYWAMAFCVLLLGLSIGYNVWLCHGTFFYMIDDPYIHLDLAETLWRTGIYGVNPDGSAVSPSSSPLWPFLLAPFGGFSWQYLVPLGINVFLLLVTLPILNTLMIRTLRHWGVPDSPKWRGVALAAIPLLLNLPCVAMTGMEQLLQVVLCLLLVLGAIGLVEQRRAPAWLWVVIFIAPLVRYECLAGAGLVLLLAMRQGLWKQSLIAGALIVAALVAFSLFLVSLGLEPVPNSIMIRKSLMGNIFVTMLLELINSMSFSMTVFGVLGIVFLLGGWLLFNWRRRNTDYSLLLIAVVAFVAHLAGGKFGPLWHTRYEIYALAFSLALIAYAGQEPLRRMWQTSAGKGVLLGILGSMVWINPLNSTWRVPIGAYAIYLQQGQMHDFAVNVWKGPVAVNDIGFVGYCNPYQVLDIWGLSSREARNALWFGGEDGVNQLVQKDGVKIALIYTNWFEFNHQVEKWYPLAVLIRPTGLTLSSEVVTVYATTRAAIPEVMAAIDRWRPRLPQDAELRLTLVGMAIQGALSHGTFHPQ